MKTATLTSKELRKATGFSDHKGNEIFEGDLLAAENYRDYPYTVTFENGDFYVHSVFGKRDLLANFQSKFVKLNIKIFVSGNVYDHPEFAHALLQ